MTVSSTAKEQKPRGSCREKQQQHKAAEAAAAGDRRHGGGMGQQH